MRGIIRHAESEEKRWRLFSWRRQDWETDWSSWWFHRGCFTNDTLSLGVYVFPFSSSMQRKTRLLPTPSVWMDESEEVKRKSRRLLKNECTKRSCLYFKTTTGLLSWLKASNKQGHAMCSSGKQCAQRESHALFKTSEPSIFYRFSKLRNKRSEVRLGVEIWGAEVRLILALKTEVWNFSFSRIPQEI